MAYQPDAQLKPVASRVSPEERALLIDRMQDLQRRIRETHGVGTDSVELLRELRERPAEQLARANAAAAEKSRGRARP